MSPPRDNVLRARLLVLTFALSFVACGPESARFRRDGGGTGGNDVGGGGDAAGGMSGDMGTGGFPANAGGAPGSGGNETGGGPGSDGAAGGNGGTDAGSNVDANNGKICNDRSQCTSGNCVDGVCCDRPCGMTCYTCNAVASPGTCVPAEGGSDPRNECSDMGAISCGSTGVCNGAGACRLYQAGTVCDTTPSCNASNSAVIPQKVCNGNGSCGAAAPQDCKGYLCSSATCGTSCEGDANCAPGAFCSAHACVSSPANIAGNGDLEYGTLDGWAGFSGQGVLGISNAGASGITHGGQWSAMVGGRSATFQGPSYELPSGPGRYTISAWGLQQTNATLSGVVNVVYYCNTMTVYLTVGPYGVSMAKSIWTQFNSPIDPPMPADCIPTATPPGMVRHAFLYLNQTAAGTPTADPDLFVDDVTVSIPDNHNLVGNPNFETGAVDGWFGTGGAALAISSTVANGGTNSLAATGRPTSTSGPSYVLPIGAVKYNLTFHALHSGSRTHDLVLQPTYTCLGGKQVTPPAVTTAASKAGNVWATLTGSLALPPADAPAGCHLVQAEVHVQQEPGICSSIECPDIYIDDISITPAP